MTPQIRLKTPSVEWPTLFICFLCYAGFAVATLCTHLLGYTLAAGVLVLALTLYSSFHHEVTHGHPFRLPWANLVLVFPALGWMIPYPRFRDTHLAHHHDPSLTDPYDDPETNFVDPAEWRRWSSARHALYRWNNTLLGRMAFGPAITLAVFYKQDLRAISKGDRNIARAYLFHATGLLPVLVWLLWLGQMPLWLYAASVYLSLSVLKIRTFLEHRAHEKARCRSVIIEDRGLLSFLFLKNNLHAVHHSSPDVPWYQLQEQYEARREAYQARNGGYVYRSYHEIFSQHFLKAKDPVPHSLWPGFIAEPRHLPEKSPTFNSERHLPDPCLIRIDQEQT